MSEAVVELTGVNFVYQESEEPALSALDLRIEAGELVILAGPSGCGKTTVTRVLNGLIPQFYEGKLTGQVRVFGKNPATVPLWETAGGVGSVFQNPRTQFFTTDVTSEVAFGCENLGFSAELTNGRTRAALRDFGRDSVSHRSVFALSGGQQQRVACASVAATEPGLFVLDEPSANLDHRATGQLRIMVARWKAEGATLVVAEHRLDYLKDLADRIIFFEGGTVVGQCSGDELRSFDTKTLRTKGIRGAPLATIPALERTQDAWEVNNLVFHYRSRAVPGSKRKVPATEVRIPQIVIPSGKVTALTGHNGCGKTTLARWLAGQLPSRRGVLLHRGKRVSRRERRRDNFLVLQDVNNQLVTESVGEEIALTLRLAGIDQSRREAILAAIDLQGFEERHPLSLSGGQKQRLAVGTALASGRELIILDEPSSGLDLFHMQGVAKALRGLADEGRTVVVITHDTELIEACADGVVRLS